MNHNPQILQHQAQDMYTQSQEYGARRTSDFHALAKDAAEVWSNLPPELRVDKEYILHALKHSPTLPPKVDFERAFPKSLRFDKQIVLTFCQRSDFTQLYKDRLLYVPDCLKNDQEVMIAYCSKIPRSLQEASEELRNNVHVVQAAVQLNGLELQYASPALRSNRELVVQACENNGLALEFCPPGPLRDELTSDRQFMLSTVLKDHGPMFRYLGPTLQHDRELVLQALEHGMRFRYCPPEYQNDTDHFVVSALQRRADLYLQLPHPVQAMRNVTLAALTSLNVTPLVLEKGLQLFPDMLSQRPVALAYVKSAELSHVQEYITEQAPNAFKDDEEIMLAAISRHSKLFTHASLRLQRQYDIVLAAIDVDSAADVLSAVGNEMLRAHPMIVVQAIDVYPKRQLRLLRTHIPLELWSDRDVALAYIRRSGRVLEVLEPLLEHDEELALEVAEHASPDFGRVGEALRSNVDFMKRAVDRNGRVLRYALVGEDNLDLAVRALAQHPHALQRTRWSSGSEVTSYIQSKLELHNNFLTFLSGIAFDRHLPSHQRSALAMLDRGQETRQAFMRLVAEFLGVPVGVELRLFRKASENLTESSSDSNNDLYNNTEAEEWDVADRRAFQRRRQNERNLGAGGLHHHDAEDALEMLLDLEDMVDGPPFELFPPPGEDNNNDRLNRRPPARRNQNVGPREGREENPGGAHAVRNVGLAGRRGLGWGAWMMERRDRPRHQLHRDREEAPPAAMLEDRDLLAGRGHPREDEGQREDGDVIEEREQRRWNHFRTHRRAAAELEALDDQAGLGGNQGNEALLNGENEDDRRNRDRRRWHEDARTFRRERGRYRRGWLRPNDHEE